MDKSQNHKTPFLSPEEGIKQGLSRELIRAWNQLVLRERFPNTPVGFSAEGEKQQAVSAWKTRCEEYRRSHEYTLLNSLLPQCDFFVGRREELSAIESALLGGDGQTKLVIHGMGGMGKPLWPDRRWSG